MVLSEIRKNHIKAVFSKIVSYNRFVEIMKMSIVPLTLYIMKYRVCKCTGINFIDSTTLDVCDSHRIYSHKVFKDFAQRGKSSTGWFYGFKKLFDNNITLVTKLKKNKFIDFSDKLLLRKRAIIESVNDFLKNICQIEHSRHRSIDNFFVNLLSALVAYSFIPKKPSLNMSVS